MKSKYQDIFCDKLIEHMSDGNCFKSFAAKIGVASRTLYDWTKKHDDFATAKSIGRAKSLEYWLKIGKELALGERKGSAVVWIFTMKNLFGWHDNKNAEPETDKTPISIQIVRDDSQKTGH